MSEAVSRCVNCGSRVPLGFRLCKLCGGRRKRVKQKYGPVNTSQYFPMMFKVNAESGKGYSRYYGCVVGPGRKVHDPYERRAKRFELYGRGSKKITEFFKK